jgi:hypothetical protein
MQRRSTSSAIRSPADEFVDHLLRHFCIRTATFDAASDGFVALNSPWYGKRSSAGFAPQQLFMASIGIEWFAVIPDLLACDAPGLKAVIH